MQNEHLLMFNYKNQSFLQLVDAGICWHAQSSVKKNSFEADIKIYYRQLTICTSIMLCYDTDVIVNIVNF